jgi:hypothetical protein
MGRQPVQRFREIDDGIAPEPLTAAHEALQDRRRPASPVTPYK